jgi:hypothetical protein
MGVVTDVTKSLQLRNRLEAARCHVGAVPQRPKGVAGTSDRNSTDCNSKGGQSMSVTIWQDDNFKGYLEFFAGYGDTPNLSDHEIGYTGLTWNDQVSSLHSTTPLYVFEDSSAAGDYAGDYALLPAGSHNLASLESFGIDNDSISAFFATYPDV